MALLVAYVDGELSDAERDGFEADLAADDGLRAELESFLRMDGLEHHFHANQARSAVTDGPRTNTWRWGLMAAAAGLLIFAALQFGSSAKPEPLVVAIAADAQDLQGSSRGPATIRDGEEWHLRVEAPSAGYLRLFAQDDLEEWHALGVAPGLREVSVEAGGQRLGPYDRHWSDGADAQRAFAAFLPLFSTSPLDESAVDRALERVRGLTPEAAARELADDLGGRTGIIAVPGS